MASFFSSVPGSHDSIRVSQPEQDPETEAAKCNSLIINLAVYICGFPTHI